MPIQRGALVINFQVHVWELVLFMITFWIIGLGTGYGIWAKDKEVRS